MMLPTVPPVAGLAALDGGAVAAAIGRDEENDTSIAMRQVEGDFDEVDGGVVKKAEDDELGDEYAKSDTHAPAAIDDWAGALYTRTNVEDDVDTRWTTMRAARQWSSATPTSTIRHPTSTRTITVEE